MSIVRHMENVSYITLIGQAILALAVRPECAGSPAKGLRLKQYKKKIGFANSALLPRKGRVQEEK